MRFRANLFGGKVFIIMGFNLKERAPLFLPLLVFASCPAYADGIMLDALFAVGLMFAIPITLFVVLVEGFAVKWFLGLSFGKAANIAFLANLVSTLAGIPLMFLERWIFYSQVPTRLDLYFKAYFLASLVTYLLFFVVTLLIERGVWIQRFNKERIAFTSGSLWKALLLGNVLTYAILCPLHYMFTSPTANVDELTSDTTWAREPTTTVFYIDPNDQYLNRIQTNGGGRETIVPFPMRDFFLSEDLKTCVYQGTDDNLYHYNESLGKQSLLAEKISDASNPSATAEDKNLVAFVEMMGSTPTLEVVPVRALFTLHEEFRAEFGLKDSDVDWLKDSATVTRVSSASFSGFRKKEDGSWQALRFPMRSGETDSSPEYEVNNYYDRTWIKNADYSVGAYYGPMEGLLYIKEGDESLLYVADSPGFLRLPKRGFSSPVFLVSGIEVLVEDGHSIYLIDLEGRRIGHLVNGNNFVIQSEQFTKQHLFESDP